MDFSLKSLMQQSFEDYGRSPDTFMERALRVCKNHQDRVTDIRSILHNHVREEWKNCSRIILKSNKGQKFLTSF